MTDVEKLRQSSITLKGKDSYWKPWGEWAIAAYLRDRGTCQYCGCNLFENYETLFGKQVVDHLLPKTKYAHLETCFWNLVTSCSFCNNLKSQWDPNSEGGPTVYDGSVTMPPSETQYIELLGRAKLFVSERRKRKAEEFQSAHACFERTIASLA
jgi:hypothetical protein